MDSPAVMTNFTYREYLSNHNSRLRENKLSPVTTEAKVFRNALNVPFLVKFIVPEYNLRRRNPFLVGEPRGWAIRHPFLVEPFVNLQTESPDYH